MVKKRKLDPDADLNDEIAEYEPSESDEDYDDNEKILLNRLHEGRNLDDDDYDGSSDDESCSENEEEVLKIYSSEGEDEDKKRNNYDDDGLKNMDSDIEGMEDDDKLPDPKAWGTRKKDYYHTDYIDQDFGGFAQEGEEEVALMEEKEARTLQSRLAAQLDNVDLSSTLGVISRKDGKQDDKLALEDDSTGISNYYMDAVKTDLTKLTKRDKMALFCKESPEFFGLVNDYKERLSYVEEKLFPVMKLIKSEHISSSLPVAKFIELKTQITLNYCTNLAFYVMLKTKRIKVKDHPVISRLLQYRTLLQKMDELETPKYHEQLNDIVRSLKTDGIDATVNCFFGTTDMKKRKNRKSKAQLSLISSLQAVTEDSSVAKKKKHTKEKRGGSELNSKYKNGIIESTDNFDDVLNDSDCNSCDDHESDDNVSPNKRLKSIDKSQVEESNKRPISYEIAKNKGLTPHRKKEQRNPRVKHRNKYRRALIRRKGQVRQVQNKLSKYGGEIFGVKASVIKSRKIK